MANRVKEDEKNERIIRNLLKLPENRRCINCNSLGPQYVCTNFWTFVCTNCSGIHREFTHRVKSVSLAKFTSQEVSALQGGGNASAKVIYFKEWDPQRHSFPDSSNVERLRDFIKHVYVERRYTGERSFEKPPMGKMGVSVESDEIRRIDTYQAGSRSPPHEDTYERRYSDRPSPGGRSDDKNYRNTNDERRSPGYDPDNRQYGNYGRSPARAEIVNDWRREDRFGNGRRSEDSRNSDGGSKIEGRSPDRVDVSSPPLVRPVRDILGESVSPLRVIEPPKVTGGRSADVSAHTQRTSSSLASSNGNPAEVRVESSLIDFDSTSEPPANAAAPQAQQTATSLPVAQPTPSSSDNWANFDFAPETKVSQAPSNATSLEYVLSELSVPASVPGHSAGVSGSPNASTAAPVGSMSTLPSSTLLVATMANTSLSPFGSISPAAAAPVSNSISYPPAVASAAASGPAAMLPVNGINSSINIADGRQWPNVHSQQNSLFPATGTQPIAQPFFPVVGGASGNMPWNSMLAPNTQGPLTASFGQAPQAVMKPVVEVTIGGVTQPSSVEVKSSGRKELPVDLFSMNYSSVSATVPGWQTGPPSGIGFTMPYSIPAPMPTFRLSSKSTNPFDLNNDSSQVHAPMAVHASMFPSMAPLQNALPNMAPLQYALPNMAPSTGLLRTSSLGNPSPAWMLPQSSHPLAVPPRAPSYSSAMPPGLYMGQQVPSNMSPRQQGLGFAPEGASFGSLNPSLPPGGLYSAPAPANAFSSGGGNPFG